MLIAAGLACVVAAVLGGYLLERGNLLVLLQPAELLIIGGSAAGILLISNPPRNIRRMLAGVAGLFRPRTYCREFYLDTLKMLYDLFLYARRNGSADLENQVEDPSASPLFQPYPKFLRDAEAVAFLCDSFRIALAAGLGGEDLDRLMRLDMESQRRERHQPVNALSALAEALPGLGIVAAVLGVVVTMQALGGAASEIGQRVAAALVGTFLGILLCYGVVNPLALHLECLNTSRAEYLQVLRMGTVTYAGGASPRVAAEFARRSIPAGSRPGFGEMEEVLRRASGRAAAVAADLDA